MAIRKPKLTAAERAALLNVDDVLDAARQYEEDGRVPPAGLGRSLRYDVWIDLGDGAGPRDYPPKVIIDLAHEFDPPANEGYARNGVWLPRLEALGFPILPKGQRPAPGRSCRGTGHPEDDRPLIQPSDVDATHIRAAARALQAWPDFTPRERASDKYRVWVDGAPFRPSPLVANACRQAGGQAKLPISVSGPTPKPWALRLQRLGFPVLPIGMQPDTDGGRGRAAQDDILQIERTVPDVTVRQRLVDARLGQGRFRRDLEQHWDGKCAVTGIATRAVLRASHIEPWAGSDNDVRLDPHNGLLLVANLDCLFDQGLISFADNGALLIGEALKGDQAAALGLSSMRGLRTEGNLHLTQKRRRYLASHRAAHGFQAQW